VWVKYEFGRTQIAFNKGLFQNRTVTQTTALTALPHLKRTHSPDQTSPDQSRPVQTTPDQTSPDQTNLDQTRRLAKGTALKCIAVRKTVCDLLAAAVHNRRVAIVYVWKVWTISAECLRDWQPVRHHLNYPNAWNRTQSGAPGKLMPVNVFFLLFHGTVVAESISGVGRESTSVRVQGGGGKIHHNYQGCWTPNQIEVNRHAFHKQN